ncbi:MAG: hypothetical protein AB1665_04490 [Candidatus Thermoplasmatota archaeon]
MNERLPSLEDWKALYKAAVKLRDLGCWDWMHDSDLFGVQDTATGEIGYCCIMGALGQHFALALYQGSEGLQGYMGIQSGETNKDYMEILASQKCLMVSFEDRKHLQKQDLEIIKRLGLQLRGRNAWPLFRSYLPGYHPWFLTGAEAARLTDALEQATDVARRFKERPEMLLPPPSKKDCVLVRAHQKERGAWCDEWVKPAPFESSKLIPEPLDEDLVARVKHAAGSRSGIWETDFFYLPGAVREKKERPWHPRVFLVQDHHSFFILTSHMEPPHPTTSFPGALLSFLAEWGHLPAEIRTKRAETYDILERLAAALRIKLTMVKRLPALEDAMDAMDEFSSMW